MFKCSTLGCVAATKNVESVARHGVSSIGARFRYLYVFFLSEIERR
jgi:hypothetical protein